MRNPEGAMVVPILGRLILYTGRIDEMADFYCRFFDFSVHRSESDRIVELSPKNAGMTILLHPLASSQKEGQVLVKLVFDVEDVAAFCASAKSKGLAFGKVHEADGYSFANAKDPARNSISVSSRAFSKR
jgi:hypothetical protein